MILYEVTRQDAEISKKGLLKALDKAWTQEDIEQVLFHLIINTTYPEKLAWFTTLDYATECGKGEFRIRDYHDDTYEISGIVIEEIDVDDDFYDFVGSRALYNVNTLSDYDKVWLNNLKGE